MSAENLFESIVDQLKIQGYWVGQQLLSNELFDVLQAYPKPLQHFKAAEVGRGRDRQPELTIRRDKIAWLDESDPNLELWFEWIEVFRQYLNRYLYLGLTHFECHFAHYQPGDFYKTHLDAFKGQSNRRVSLVTYLNENWLAEWGGQLELFAEDGQTSITQILPLARTLVIFMSDEFPHQVWPATQSRWSLAGWFRTDG